MQDRMYHVDFKINMINKYFTTCLGAFFTGFVAALQTYFLTGSVRIIVEVFTPSGVQAPAE